MSGASFSLCPVEIEDVPVLAKYTADAFLGDRQTQMKRLAKVPYDLEDVAKSDMSEFLANPAFQKRNRLIKAVDNATGNIMGHARFGFVNFDPKDVPSLEGKSSPAVEAEKLPSELKTEEKRTINEAIKGTGAWRKFTASDEEDPIKPLESLTGADMNRWIKIFEPEGEKCIRVGGLATAPEYQRRGVGSAMLRWATSTADKHRVTCWVHSSESAWGAYAKCGFEVVGTLDVDLDEYALGPPPEEGGDGKWGHYIFRYMQYFPKAAQKQE